MNVLKFVIGIVLVSQAWAARTDLCVKAVGGLAGEKLAQEPETPADAENLSLSESFVNVQDISFVSGIFPSSSYSPRTPGYLLEVRVSSFDAPKVLRIVPVRGGGIITGAEQTNRMKSVVYLAQALVSANIEVDFLGLVPANVLEELLENSNRFPRHASGTISFGTVSPYYRKPIWKFQWGENIPRLLRRSLVSHLSLVTKKLRDIEQVLNTAGYWTEDFSFYLLRGGRVVVADLDCFERSQQKVDLSPIITELHRMVSAPDW